ncbi:hypothetical protein QQG55_38665 [Brugia pahangi]
MIVAHTHCFHCANAECGKCRSKCKDSNSNERSELDSGSANGKKHSVRKTNRPYSILSLYTTNRKDGNAITSATVTCRKCSKEVYDVEKILAGDQCTNISGLSRKLFINSFKPGIITNTLFAKFAENYKNSMRSMWHLILQFLRKNFELLCKFVAKGFNDN